MMTGERDLQLALAYLVGRVDQQGRVAVTSFKMSPVEIEECRAAIVRLLGQPRPPRRLLDVLAALFDPDDNLLSQRRHLVIKGRKKGPLRDAAREFDLLVEIKLAYLKTGKPLQEVMPEVAEQVGMSEGGLWDVWNRNPILRDVILSTIQRS